MTRWTAYSYAYAALVALVLAYFLLGVPIQLTDSFGNMQQLDDGTLADLLYSQLYQRGYLRPLLWGHLRVVYDLADGNYYAWFRGWHVAQVVLLFILFLRLMRPRTAGDAAAITLGLAALIGVHTFAGTVREAFPINTFMTILLCCFAAADLAMGEPRWWRNLLAWIVFVFAALTVESGLLIAVVFVAAYLVGGRGISRTGIVGILALFAGYFWLRFVYLEVGSPDLMERSSGFGFGSMEPDELRQRFGSNPIPFYAYNIVASIATVLLGEPRGGTYGFTHALLTDEPRTFQIISVCASTLGTVLIVSYAWARRAALRAWTFDRSDRIVAIFVAVLLANATVSYPYTKDVIMSPAGAFFAAALAVAAAHFLNRLSSSAIRLPTAVVAALLIVTSSVWALRAVGIHVALRHSSVAMRNEWAYADRWFAQENNAPTTPKDIRLKEQLQNEAIARSRPVLSGDWLEWFEN